MSQHDMVLADAVGAAFRADANLALLALISNSSGATEPATMYAYQFWADTTTGLLKQRNSTNTAWITKGSIADTWAALGGLETQAFLIKAATLAAHALRAGQYGSQINGWTYANNVGDATNDIDIAAGSGLDSTRAYFISGSALTKQSDAAWAVGTNAGMLDTGAVGNSDYYLWAIARSDTGVVDYLSSLSSTAPTMPANYDYKRLIGWFKRVGGTIVAFHTYETEGGGIEFTWDAPTTDVSLANTLTTSRRTDALKVPLNLSTVAIINALAYDAASGCVVNICCPDQTDAAPSGSVAPLAVLLVIVGNSGNSQLKIRTSATGTVASRSNLATVDLFVMVTIGFTWARRV